MRFSSRKDIVLDEFSAWRQYIPPWRDKSSSRWVIHRGCHLSCKRLQGAQSSMVEHVDHRPDVPGRRGPCSFRGYRGPVSLLPTDIACGATGRRALPFPPSEEIYALWWGRLDGCLMMGWRKIRGSQSIIYLRGCKKPVEHVRSDWYSWGVLFGMLCCFF